MCIETALGSTMGLMKTAIEMITMFSFDRVFSWKKDKLSLLESSHQEPTDIVEMPGVGLSDGGCSGESGSESKFDGRKADHVASQSWCKRSIEEVIVRGIDVETLS
jgi:hypothetical protein